MNKLGGFLARRLYPVEDHRNEYMRCGLSVMSLKLMGRIPEGV